MTPRHSSEVGVEEASVAELLLRAESVVTSPQGSQAKLLEQLRDLRRRFLAARFQLAVLGQFKRGKSTLLNALLGLPIVPTGVVPVTAIPTFFVAGESPRLTVVFLDGRTEERVVPDAANLRTQLDAMVTEAHNPDNALGIARVEVVLPSALLAHGVVLIDTPGVGSTLEHNTAAAHAALAECDAALFVVSPDPPITQAEVTFLARLRPAVASLHVVLNKVDLLEDGERPVALDYLRRVLGETGLLDPLPPVFCVSARQAVRAQAGGEVEGWRASGLPELEAHLVRFLAGGKQATLRTSVARKASALLGELRLDLELRLAALELPLADLARRLEAFNGAVVRLEAERRAAHDGLAGDRTRALQALEADAERLRDTARAALLERLDAALARGADAKEARRSLEEPVHQFFEHALAETSAAAEERWMAALAIHHRRTDELINLVRRTAADLLDIPFRGLVSEEAFAPRRRPFWVTRKREDLLDAIPVGTLERFLPKRVRRRRERRRLAAEIDAVVRRNVENLRWSSRQNLEEAFHALQGELDERLAATLEATQGAIATTLQRRETHSSEVAGEIERRRAALDRLRSLQVVLEQQA